MDFDIILKMLGIIIPLLIGATYAIKYIIKKTNKVRNKNILNFKNSNQNQINNINFGNYNDKEGE